MFPPNQRSPKNFVALVRSNDEEKLSSFCASNKVSFTDLKESIGVAATEVLKQACEHHSDVKAEFHAVEAAVISGGEEIKGMKPVVLLNKDETISLKSDVLAVKEAVDRIEKESGKFTLYKFIGYASVVSLFQCLYTWGLGEYLLEKVEKAKTISPKIPSPKLPSDETIKDLPGP